MKIISPTPRRGFSNAVAGPEPGDTIATLTDKVEAYIAQFLVEHDREPTRRELGEYCSAWGGRGTTSSVNFDDAGSSPSTGQAGWRCCRVQRASWSLHSS